MDLSTFPETALEFESRFADEPSCWEYLWQAKWPRGFRCSRCNGRKAYYVIERKLEECASCGYQASVTAGTMFHGTRNPLRMWFRAIFEFTSRKHGCNAMDIQRLLGLSYHASWEWLQKIRDVFVRKERAPLCGTVEADETYIGGPEDGVKGRDLGKKKILVFGAVEVVDGHCGRARLAPIESASADQIQPALSEVVEEGATVKTDGWQGYRELGQAYKHRVKVIGDDPKRASRLFPHIQGVFSLLRRLILGTYHGSLSEKYAALYCEEFTFRFNRRTSKSRVHLFRRVIEQAMRRPPRLHLMRGRSRSALVLPEAA